MEMQKSEKDIISACDRLIDSLEKAIKNAYEVILLMKEIKKWKYKSFSANEGKCFTKRR